MTPHTHDDLPSLTSPKFHLNRPARPMLSRVAESIYWMSRYVERAEHVARLILVTDAVLTDVGDIAPKLQQRLWDGVLRVFHLDQQPAALALLQKINADTSGRVAAYMAFDLDNPNSVLSCLTKARENARSIREVISAEMWESLNTLYWTLRTDDSRTPNDDAAQEAFRQVKTGSFLLQGLAAHTMAHEQGYRFVQLAASLERAAITSRIVETKFEVLRAAESTLEVPLRNIHWMAVLRSCCSIEAYRRLHPGDMDPLGVATFLILQRQLPRTICYGVHSAHEALLAIHAGLHPHGASTALRILGRLDARLQTAEPQEILADGVLPYLHGIQQELAQGGLELHKEYFLH